MILTCPNCSTKFKVKAGAIPPAGRKVKCKSCANVWHAMPEEEPAAVAPAAPPPPATLLVEASALPSPLRRFRGDRQAEAVQIAFPPQGAVLSVGARDLVVKLRGGTPPFTVLADGRPVALRLYRRETVLPPPGPGFVTLSVIDALGTSGRVSFELR